MNKNRSTQLENSLWVRSPCWTTYNLSDKTSNRGPNKCAIHWAR